MEQTTLTEGASKLRQHQRTFEAYALATEGGPELGEKLREWYDFYQPASPGEREHIEMSLMSSILRRRVLAVQTEIANQQIRTAVHDADCAMEDQVERYREMLPTQPRAAMIGLKRSAMGLRFLIQRWERLLLLLYAEQSWSGNDRDEAINYLGARAGVPENLFASDGAFLTWVYCVMTQADPKDKDFAVLGRMEVMPKAIQDRKPEHWLPLRDLCLTLLQQMAERELSALRPREEYLRLTFEEPDRDGAETAKQVVAGSLGAQLLQQYRTYDIQYHRAYNAFLKGRKETGKTGLLPGQPDPDIHGAANATPATDLLPEPDAAPVKQARAARKQAADRFAPGRDHGVGATAAADIYRAAVVATGLTREQIEATARAEEEEQARQAARASAMADTQAVPETSASFG